MYNAPRHISHFIRKALSRHTDTSPLAEVLLGLPEQRYKCFQELVIPTQDGITTLDWVVVRADCVFLIQDGQDSDTDLSTPQSQQDRWTAIRLKARYLAALLRRFDYHGVVQHILVTSQTLDCDVTGNLCPVTITDLGSFLDAYTPVTPEMKPAFAIALCRAIEQAMAARRYLNLVNKYTGEEREDFFWMQEFEPPQTISSRRDFAFRQALKAQATYRTDKGK